VFDTYAPITGGLAPPGLYGVGTRTHPSDFTASRLRLRGGLTLWSRLAALQVVHPPGGVWPPGICWTALKLRDGTISAVRDPDVGAVKEHSKGTVADGKCAQQGAVTGTQLAHIVVAEVRHPDIGAVKGHPRGVGAGGKGAQQGAIAGAQLAHNV